MNEQILISPSELAATMTKAPMVLIDTRDPSAYAAGHLPGAVNLRDIFTYLATSSAEGKHQLEEKFAEEFGAAGLSGAETAVLYEDNMHTGFGQSCRGYYLLKYLGYPKVKVLHGGFGAWSKASLPVTTAASRPKPAKFPVRIDPAAVMVDKDEMLRALSNPSIVKLDVRDVVEWIGKSSSPYGVDFCPRKGRIPNAKWLEWYRMMKPTELGQMFKDPDEILAECATVGIDRDSTVYLYCFKGARAANTYLALQEAGIRNVKIYFGSWNEWSREFSLPIETVAAAEEVAEPA